MGIRFGSGFRNVVGRNPLVTRYNPLFVVCQSRDVTTLKDMEKLVMFLSLPFPISSFAYCLNCSFGYNRDSKHQALQNRNREGHSCNIISDHIKVPSDHVTLALFSFGSISVVGWATMMLLNGHDKIREIRDLTYKC